jgi:8-oxo-dGTP diphosphatase
LSSDKQTYEVVAAIIIQDNKILCAQRGEGKYPFLSYKFEFPGGKVEKGETNQQAIIREIREELNVTVSVEKTFISVHHAYPDFDLNLHSFICSCENAIPVLTEHIDIKWLDACDLKSLEWAPADIPIVDALMAR